AKGEGRRALSGRRRAQGEGDGRRGNESDLNRRPTPLLLPAAFVLAVLSALGGCRRPAALSRPFAGASRPDVVLITIDTLRADSVGFLGNKRVQTPALDRLAREGLVFPDAHAQSVVTLPSHANILTGLYPYQHGVRDNEGFVLPENLPTLATLLHDRGYATGAFIGAFPLDSRFGLSRGFDVYDQSYPQGANEDQFVMPERPASEVVAAARAWLAAANTSPRFAWIHLYDCHAPYRPPPPFDSRFAGEPYLGEVAAVDAALAPLVGDLAARGRPVLVIVTSDHGEALGDHGERTHGLFAYEATLRVPLVLWSPGQIAARSDPRAARHVDILPTVVEAAGGGTLPAGATGRPLLGRAPAVSSTSNGAVADTSYFESLTSFYTRGWAPLRGVIGGGFKYVDLPLPELYDLRADPGEARNLAATRLDVLRALKARLPAFSAAAAAPGSSSAETAGKLRSLGYLSGRAAGKDRFGPEDDPKNLVAIDSETHEMIDLYQRGHAAEAMALAQKIVRERPGMASGYEYLSFLQGQSGDDPAAVKTLREAERRGLLDERLKSRLGLLLSGIGRGREALAVLEPLSGSEDPDVANALGIARAGAGQTAPAIQSFEHALRLDPRNAVAWQNIGITLVHARDLQGALRAFDKAFALNERLPRAWNGRGVVLEELGRHAEAVAAWKRAVALDPGQLDALFNIGIVSAQQGDGPTARVALEQFVARVPASRAPADVTRARGILSRLPG
ncbi:MAG: sulfatase-like hydrolase/transferase, partial [Acidobacteriota bacterium]